MHQAQTNVRTLDIRKENCNCSRTPCETALKDKGAEQSWKIFEDTFHTGGNSQMYEIIKGRQESGMNEPRPSCQTKRKEENAQTLEAGTGVLGRV